MYRTATDLLINRHHVNHEFTYRQLQLKLRILRDQSNYFILTRLNAKKWQLRTVAETLLVYGTEDSTEILRQSEARDAERERELEELESGSESELTPKDLEQDAIHNGNLLPDYQDPEYTELGLRAYSQTVRVAYNLPERLKYNEHAPESRLKMATPDIYVESELNLVPYASHITYASDLVTNQANVSEYLSDEEQWDFIEGMHHSEWYMLWDNAVPGGD